MSTILPEAKAWQQVQLRGPLAQLLKPIRQRKRSLFVGLMILELLYVFVSVPLRIGFLFDPYAIKDWTTEWTLELTAFTVLDVLADIASLANLLNIFALRRRKQAAVAADTLSSIGARRQQTTEGSSQKRVARTRASMQGTWSLNAIIPLPPRPSSVLFEMVAMLPLELFALVFGPNSLHLLRFLKLLRLYRVPDCMREVKDMYTSSSMVQMLEYTGNTVLFNTVLLGLAASHWMACGYMAVAHFECGLDFMLCSKARTVLTTIASTGDHNTAEGITGVSPSVDGAGYTCWAIEDYLVGTSIGRQYGRAIYWASRSIMTAGFYDVAATTNLETLYVIVAQVLGATFSTAVLATFLFIFRYRNARMQEFRAHVDSAKEYMKARQFPDSVRDGVLGYYKNVWATHHALHPNQVIERLPGHLKLGVYRVLKVHRIQQVSFLSNMSVEFINTLALRVEYCVYSPKDWIIERLSDGMYFVLRGTVQLNDPRCQQPRIAKTGEHFAEGSLLFPGPWGESARAQTYCDLYKLSQSSFYKTLATFYREKVRQRLEKMRSMHVKRMLASRLPADNAMAYTSPTPCTNRHSIVFGTRLLPTQQIPWRLPGSTFRQWWEHARLFAVTFVVFEVPLYCVFDAETFPFDKESAYSVQSITSVLVEGFFVMDFVLRARVFAYIDHSHEAMTMTHSKDIFHAYRGNGLWLDLLSINPLPLIVEFVVQHRSGWTMWCHNSRIIRFLRARYLPQIIQEVAHIRGLSSKMQQAGTILLYVTLTLHGAGCLWFLMARLSVSEGNFKPILEPFTRDRCLRDAGLSKNCSWTVYDAYGQLGTTFQVQDPHHSIYTVTMAYLRSIYWAIVALTTVGYGDIVAFSTYESYFAALWIFVGGIINYGVLGAMSSIISNLTAASRHHSEMMNTINVTLGHFRISESIRVRIRQFYHQQLYAQKVTSEVELLDGLPNQLRHRISSILHAESVRKVPLFVEAQNRRLLYELTGLFRRQLFQRGDAFVAEGSLCQEMYVVVNGQANVYTKRVGAVPVGALSSGNCFGVCELLLQKCFTTTVVAATVVDVSMITFSAFVAKIERQFPTEVEALRHQAAQQYIHELLTLEAVVDNIKTRSTLAKFIEQCTSMFHEKENCKQQQLKTQLRLYWDLIVLTLDVYTAFQVTFRIAFLPYPSSNVRLLLVTSDVVGDVLLLVDIYLKLYYFECQDVGLRNLLSRAQRSTSYKLRRDLLSSLPLYYVGSSFLIMSLCRLPRLLRLGQIPGMLDSLIMRLQQHFSTRGNISACLSPIKPVLILLFTGHLAACVFYLVCHLDPNPKNWTHHDPIVHLEHGSTGVLYLRAFYWALTTLTLVGSREIVPLAIPGTVWAILTCLCCAFIVGHIVSELSELVLEMDASKKQRKEREAQFDKFAHEQNLPASVRIRVLHYLKFHHNYLKGTDIYTTFKDLSRNLRIQLLMDLHGETLHHLCIAPFLNQVQIHGLALRLTSELYVPGDTILVEGDLGHKLYIVNKGTAMVLWKSTGTAIATLSAGQVFGEVAFFLRGQRRIATVQATSCSELLVLERRAWKELLASSPQEEAQSTERALVQWVKLCLKRYAIMTIEIVKKIRSKGNDGSSRKKPKRIGIRGRLSKNAFHTLRDVASFRQAAVATLEERKARHLLRKTAAYNGKQAETAPTPGVLTVFKRWVYGKLLPKGSKVATLETTHADNSLPSGNEPQSTGNGAPPSRYLFPWYTAKDTTAARGRNETRSPKNGSNIPLNAVSRSMRESYGNNQAMEMIDECWRRYKVSLFIAEACSSGIGPKVSNAESLQDQTLNRSQAAATLQTTSTSDEDNASSASKVSRGASTLRKALSSAIVPNANPHQGFGTTDGRRFLANYESQHHLCESLDRSHSSSNLPFEAGRAHCRHRKLKRSQSLPLFDRHVIFMIQEELQASNAKVSESKLDLDLELLQRCRQAELSSLFRVYLSWLERREQWRQWYATFPCIKHFLRFSDSRSNLKKDGPRQPQSVAYYDDIRSSPVAGPSASLLPRQSTSSTAENFVNGLSRCYRLWEWIVVLVGLFYAVTLPFFLCFASDLATFHEDGIALARWMYLVICVDVICIADLVLKHSAFRHILLLSDGGDTNVHRPKRLDSSPSTSHASNGSQQTTSTQLKRWWQQHVKSCLWLDVITSLPFDVLLLLPPLSTSSLAKYRWFNLSLFQLNKVPRIPASIETSERLTQYLATDLKLPFGESRLHFIRTLCVYILSGH